MTDALLDTSVLIDLVYEDEEAITVHDELAGTVATTTVCLYELAKFFEEAHELLADREVYPLASADAAEAGRIYRTLHDRGELLGETDTLIAGVARTRGLTLVTRDDDFERVPDLDLRLF